MTPHELTVLFADLSGSTRLYQMQGDVKAHKAITRSLQCMKRAVETNDGTLLRTVGDSALASFSAADSACDAAIAIQTEHAKLGMSVRVGFHVGQVIPDSGDVYGNSVNLAARVAGFAEANEICTTGAAVASLSLKHRENTHFLDTVEFKGMAEPMPVFRVHWQEGNAQTVIVTDQPAMQPPQSRQSLLLSCGEQQRVVNLGDRAQTLGRAMDSDIVVEHESASRHHARIEIVRGRCMLSDTSTNGTFILRQGAALEFLRREAVPLGDAGVIGLGFSPEEEPAQTIRYEFTRSLDNGFDVPTELNDAG